MDELDVTILALQNCRFELNLFFASVFLHAILKDFKEIIGAISSLTLITVKKVKMHLDWNQFCLEQITILDLLPVLM